MISKTAARAKRVMSIAAFCAALAGPFSAHAAAPQQCVSLEEAGAFKMRHLQSRLMVAALGCNQQAAYNTFVEHFRDHLVSAGGHLTNYYKRAGGQAALNRHITDLANVAGLRRAESPTDYCTHAWNLFWSLEQDPHALSKVADENIFGDIARPQMCTVTVATDLDRKSLGAQNATATFDATKAAADKSKP